MLCTRSNHDSSIKDASYDSCSGGGSFREREALGVQGRVAGEVREVEARHFLFKTIGAVGDLLMGMWERWNRDDGWR